MSQAANASTASRRRALMGHFTVAAVCAALMAGCGASGSRSGAHVGTTVSATASSTAPTTTTTRPAITYRVKRGDTLTTIARQFRVSISAIIFINHVADPNRLTEGQTLRIPPAPPVKLVITPRAGPQGQAFQLNLTGAKPSETITFEIDSPKGKYTGKPHTASADGAVTATYQTSYVAPTATYKVIANGNEGTTARAGFRVIAASTDHT